MLKIEVDTKGVLGFMDRLSSQYRFAVALALTNTAKEVADAMPAITRVQLDNPTPFTQRGFYFKRAEKIRLEAEVGVKQQQAEYLRWQVEGGVRQPKRQALRLPSEIQLNPYGNMPAGLVRQLIARAKAGRRATKTQARRFGVSQQVDLFYGEPGDGRPAGIYKRIALPGRDNRLVPLVVFPKQSARYEKRFDFYGEARRIVQRRFNDHVRTAWARAMATAR